VLGLPTEGQVGDRRRVGHHLCHAVAVGAAATVGDARAARAAAADAVPVPVAVVDDEGVLLGSLDEAALALPATTPVDRAMVRAPGTIRPDERLDDALQQLRGDGLAFSFVSTAHGRLLGVLCRDEHV
jgi:CBS domain-containing protein